MKPRWIILPALTAAMFAAQTTLAQQYGPQGPPPPNQYQNGYGQNGYGQGPYGGQPGWDAPPPDFQNDLLRRAFRDGIGAARSDFEARRGPDSHGRPEYRRPPVPGRARNDYRNAFQRGYDVGFGHMQRRDERRDERRDDRRDDRRDGYPPPPPPR